MAYSKQDYSFALDESSILTQVDNATKDRKYFCPYCNAPMIPRQGAKRKWHFAHKPDTHGLCSYESYLHKLAKMLIKKCFDETDKFNITFNVESTCNVIDCPINIKTPCSWHEPKTFEIKRLYDTCSIEKRVDNFIADLVLTSSTNPSREPIIIEIYVTHKSTEEKINSGLRIIEIKIKSEEDIAAILNARSISESDLFPEDIFYVNAYSEKIDEDSVKFYNFKGHNDTTPSYKYQHQRFHFWIDNKPYYHNSKISLDEDYDYNIFNCLSALTPELSSAVFRIDSSHPIDLDFAFAELEKSGLNIKFCNMCNFYKYNEYLCRSLCTLYKSQGTAKYPRLSCANTCPHFSLRKFDYQPNECDDFGYKIYIKK